MTVKAIYTLPDLTGASDEEIKSAFDRMGAAFEEEADELESLDQYEAFRIRCLLKKGAARWVPLAKDRKDVGAAFNHLKDSLGWRLPEIQSQVAGYAKLVELISRPAVSNQKSLDLSLPGIRRSIGVEHPLTRTMREMTAVFAALGYSVGVGPEVETDFYNFEALNFPPNHPARDTQDTLVVADQEGKPLRERLLMRTHTSPVQIRSMVTNAPPLRIVIPGKVHRNDESDATHSPIFHQVEGLCVDTNITFSDLKGTLDYAMKAFFGSSVKTRFFPSFFPFTEPSADVQISCPFCGQKGCRKCKFSGWIELLGCGMVDPAVFAAVDARRIENGLEPAYDNKQISGFAFGMGVERIAMMKYGVGDIGQFYSGDMRFLGQFV